MTESGSTDSSSASSIPITSSKLVPAAAPAVSAWGKKLEVSAPEAPSNGIKKDEWPTVDVSLTKEAATSSATSSAKEKVKAVPPKVKSSGKEKWVPYEATIILPSGNNSGNSSNKKKSNNRKRGANNQNGHSANQNSNGKKKDGHQQQQHRGQSGQKKQNDASRKSDHNVQKQSLTDSKTTLNINEIAEAIATLDVKGKDNDPKLDPTILSSSSTPSPRAEKTSIASASSADLSADTPTKSDLSTVTEGTSRSGQESASSAQSQTPENIPSLGKQQHSHKRNQSQQHRNSEPFLANNGSYYNVQNRGRRAPNNKQYNNARHSISGGFGGLPYMLNYPYGYGMVPAQFGYTQPYFNNAGSRSNSQSPHKGEYASLNMPQNVPGVPPFVPQPMMYNTYEVDPLTLVVNQLNYYFSTENLLKDIYLRKQMNSNGFVPLKKLIQFNRLKALTGGNINVMVDALKLAPALEVRDEKVRVIENWANWVLPVDQRDETGKLEDEEDEDTVEDENKE